jgi:hypothetical protein
MFDVDATIEARGVAIATFGEYDAVAGPPSQGALGGGYGTAFGIRLARMFTPFIGFEQGYLACSDCNSKSAYDNMFFGLRYETPNEGAFGFRGELDLGYRSVRASKNSYVTFARFFYGPGVGTTGKWSGLEPRLSIGPTLRLGSIALDLSLTGAIGRFSRVEWSGIPLSTTGIPSASASSMSISDDASRTHAFVGLTLGARALLPIR